MKKCVVFVLLAMFCSCPLTAKAEDISARSAIVYQPQTQTVLFEKNADERSLVASTTKIMTALVVLDECDLDEVVDIRRECTDIEGSTMYLKAGESYTVKELLYGMMLVSGNDAAASLACHVAGNIENFAALMNKKAAELSLTDSHFVNPHGLDAEEHYSTARDLAVLTAAAMENEIFCEIFSTQSCRIQGVNYQNHNKLLKSCEGCTGGKTGYTEAAGRILVSSCKREDMELICVTIAAPDDWNDHQKLYDSAYDAYRFVPALDERSNQLGVISGTSEFARLQAKPSGVLVKKDSTVEIRTFLPDFVFAPVLCGQRAGEVQICVDGQISVIPVTYAQTVLIDGNIPLTPWERFKRAWYLSCRYGVYYPEY